MVSRRFFLKSVYTRNFQTVKEISGLDLPGIGETGIWK